MCSPLLAITALSTGLSVVGSIQQANAQASAAKTNAAILDQQARSQQLKANFDKAQAERNFRRTRGRQTSAAAGSGFSVMSFADIFEDSKLESGLEIKAIQFSADAEIANLTTQANAQRTRAKNARTAGVINAFSGVVGGIGQGFKSGAINLNTAFRPIG